MTTSPLRDCVEDDESITALLRRAPWIAQLVRENERLLCTIMALQEKGVNKSRDACKGREEEEEQVASSSHSFVSTQSGPLLPNSNHDVKLDKLCASARHTLRTAHLLQPLLRANFERYCDGTPRSGRRPADAGDRLRHDMHQLSLLLPRLQICNEVAEESETSEPAAEDVSSNNSGDDDEEAAYVTLHHTECRMPDQVCTELAELTASLRDGLAEAIQLCYDVLRAFAEHVVNEKN